MTPEAPVFSVVVCSLNGERVLPACLRCLRVCSAAGKQAEVIVVDNGSTDATPRLVAADFPWVRLIRTGRNLGFAGGNNVGIRACQGRLIVLLNDDTQVPAQWLEKLRVPFERDPKIGVVGCKLLFPGGRIIQHAGGDVYPNGNTMHRGYGQPDRGQWDEGGERTYVTGAAVAFRRQMLVRVGLLDPGFFPIYFEETELQVRAARAGWRIWYEPAAWLIHHESQSQGAASARFVYRYTRNRIRFLAMHGFPEGKVAALRWEMRGARDILAGGRLGALLRGYVAGLVHWPAWRLDRRRRRSLPMWDGRPVEAEAAVRAEAG